MATAAPRVRRKRLARSTFAHGPQTDRPVPKVPISLIDACRDPNLFGGFFKDAASWWPWLVFIKVVFGLDLDAKEYEFFQKCTGRNVPPTEAVKEGWLVCGRRSGKSFISSLIATYLAAFYDWTPFLAPGERGMIMVIASDRKQARVIFRYIEALMRSSPLLYRLVENHTMESFSLRGRVTIEIHSASFRAVRGYTVVAALLDEIAFFQAENSANPDKEIIEAIRPAMATVPGAMLFGLSSPYAQRGVLYEAYKNYFSEDEPDVVVWQAPTWYMNPTIPNDFFERAYRNDSVSASAEYGAEFRKDTDAFIPEEAYSANVDRGIYERPYTEVNAPYFGFVDPSGGSRDSFTLAIAHIDPESPEDHSRKILDLIREYTPPFSPDVVVKEMADVLAKYHIAEVVGDRYSGEWVSERFRHHGIEYTVSSRTKSEIYKAVLPELMSNRALLLDNERMHAQFLILERRSGGHGRDLIDHPRGAKDDVANAVAGALVESEPMDRVELW